ncbi:MAG: DUF2939 domain-containing protein [Gammaproteobacteria bacterium]|nr:DUF2939 domain-containing protein [Gammaproteobacteria bacterium]
MTIRPLTILMKYIGLLLFLIFIIFLVAPYLAVYQLGDALIANDTAVLGKFIDLEAIRKEHKEVLQRHVKRTVGRQNNMVTNFVRDGAKALGDAAVNAAVDMNWVRDSLKPPKKGGEYPSLFSAMSFGFFESPTRFLLRIGELGDDPIHAYLTLKDWNWRVTAVYR